MRKLEDEAIRGWSFFNSGYLVRQEKLWTLQILRNVYRPFISPKTFRSPYFIFEKNAISQDKQLIEPSCRPESNH